MLPARPTQQCGRICAPLACALQATVPKRTIIITAFAVRSEHRQGINRTARRQVVAAVAPEAWRRAYSYPRPRDVDDFRRWWRRRLIH